jgi:sodium/bile acid cotransporter 7
VQRLLALLFPDRFVALLLAMVAVAVLAPARGAALEMLGDLSTLAIIALFFVHGARLSRHAVLGGFRRVRLHMAILAATFLFFPLVGLLIAPLADRFVGPAFTPGILFLCALPTTVASSIAMVSIARGNIPASVIAAALSSMAGVVLTPLIFAALLSTSGGGIDLSGIFKVILILAVPFAIGQLCRPLIGGWIEAHPGLGRLLDRLTILLAIYVALSAAAGGGLFDDIAAGRFLALLGFMMLLLVLVAAMAVILGKLLRFDYGDRTSLLFAAMQKSVISGTPMARILFPGAEAGLIILPLLVYYVPMMTVSAIIATRMGKTGEQAAN